MLYVNKISISMDDEVFEKAKEEDMSKDEAEELQELMDETGLDVTKLMNFGKNCKEKHNRFL